MAAPEYVPRPKAEKARVYESPPWRSEPWISNRPADLGPEQPIGPRFGSPGPDQGFVLKLAHAFEGKLALARDEREEDALTGACAVALRRASLFGRAPVIHDLTVALRIYGFLTEGGPPDTEIVRFRRPLFEGCSGLHHYSDLRDLVDLLPEAVVRLSPGEVLEQAKIDWRAFFPATATAP